MKFKLCTVRSNEFIAPGVTSQWYTEMDNCLFIEASSPYEVEWRKNRRRVQQGAFVIGKKFRLYNYSNQPIRVRGMILRLLPGKRNNWLNDEPIVLDPAYLVHHQLTSLLDIFDQTEMTAVLLSATERDFGALYRTLHTIRTDEARTKSLTGRIDSRLIRVHRFIRSNYCEQLTLQDLADLIGCNPVYLSNMYSTVFKISPVKHLQSVRMQQALQLLSATTQSIAEITKHLGYVSNSQFSSMFKKYHGVTPTEYRINQKCQSIK